MEHFNEIFEEKLASGEKLIKKYCATCGQYFFTFNDSDIFCRIQCDYRDGGEEEKEIFYEQKEWLYDFLLERGYIDEETRSRLDSKIDDDMFDDIGIDKDQHYSQYEGENDGDDSNTTIQSKIIYLGVEIDLIKTSPTVLESHIKNPNLAIEKIHKKYPTAPITRQDFPYAESVYRFGS